ncbi:ABC transporter related protein [Candidatus Vecturithrix granuli]|uniref:ABC transporter related protein n=1 Tax=Vecturithrix granuli TaxID=1499967 RepID=A0A0S6W5X6_VECG1|nr:ABC transporter related protein [Candidatus Vecturithrix granuli]
MNPSEHRLATSVSIEGVSKAFGKLQALKFVSLQIERGEFFTLLGPSGCGKTTLLRTIAGFEQPDHGRILFNDTDVTSLPPWDKQIGFVFQNYALWPNMNVFQNIAYGLKIRKKSAQEIAEKVRWGLDLVNLPGIETKFPEQLSGGQQQRIAIARALVIDPQILLLDEPLSNLDAKLRISLRKQIREIQNRLALTVVYVTHDQEEALEISDRIAVMNLGEVQQVAAPDVIYEEPVNLFVADFVGKTNVLNGSIDAQGRFVSQDAALQFALAEQPCSKTTLLARPENISVTTASDSWHLHGVVQRRFYLGNIKRYEVRLPNQAIFLIETHLNLKQEEKIYLRFEHYRLLTASTQDSVPHSSK